MSEEHDKSSQEPPEGNEKTQDNPENQENATALPPQDTAPALEGQAQAAPPPDGHDGSNWEQDLSDELAQCAVVNGRYLLKDEKGRTKRPADAPEPTGDADMEIAADQLDIPRPHSIKEKTWSNMSGSMKAEAARKHPAEQEPNLEVGRRSQNTNSTNAPSQAPSAAQLSSVRPDPLPAWRQKYLERAAMFQKLLAKTLRFHREMLTGYQKREFKHRKAMRERTNRHHDMPDELMSYPLQAALKSEEDQICAELKSLVNTVDIFGILTKIKETDDETDELRYLTGISIYELSDRLSAFKLRIAAVRIPPNMLGPVHWARAWRSFPGDPPSLVLCGPLPPGVPIAPSREQLREHPPRLDRLGSGLPLRFTSASSGTKPSILRDGDSGNITSLRGGPGGRPRRGGGLGGTSRS